MGYSGNHCTPRDEVTTSSKYRSKVKCYVPVPSRMSGKSASMSRKRLLEVDVEDRTYAQSNRRFCPHCSQFVVQKTYRAHKRLYFSGVRIFTILS